LNTSETTPPSIPTNLATAPATAKADLQIFLRAHNERNLAAYEGRIDIDEELLADLIQCTKRLETAVGKLAPPPA